MSETPKKGESAPLALSSLDGAHGRTTDADM